MALWIILGIETKSFDVLTSDQELEVRTATYGPEIDQSQHVKSVSHIIKTVSHLIKHGKASFEKNCFLCVCE